MGSKHAIGVLGPIPQRELGLTLPHEHVLLDMDVRYHPAGDDDSSDTPHLADRWKLLRNPGGYRANLRSIDLDETLSELSYFRDSGGQTIVDLSPHGLAHNSVSLPLLAERSGVNIIAATGTYIAEAMPDWARDASVEQLADEFTRDLLTTDRDGFQRGVIGEIGIESGSDAEVRAVAASARAQAATGAPCFWHVMAGILPTARSQVQDLVNLYEHEGGDPHALVLCHQDASGSDVPYQELMLQRGVWLSFDNFGFESVFAYGHGYIQNPTDTERINSVADLLDRGWQRQILLSQDICYRMMRRSWGGWGFAHILDSLQPRFTAAGVDDATMQVLMRDNPGRLLAFADSSQLPGLQKKA